MEQRLSMITLGVADLERAKAFYENVVGWKAAPGPPEIAFFDLRADPRTCEFIDKGLAVSNA